MTKYIGFLPLLHKSPLIPSQPGPPCLEAIDVSATDSRADSMIVAAAPGDTLDPTRGPFPAFFPIKSDVMPVPFLVRFPDTLSRRLLIAMSTLFSVLGLSGSPAFAELAAEKISVLIVDGQNNHGNWPQTTQMMKAHLEDSGRFTVDVATHAPKGEDSDFAPAFADYAAVLSNFGHAAPTSTTPTMAASSATTRRAPAGATVPRRPSRS